MAIEKFLASLFCGTAIVLMLEMVSCNIKVAKDCETTIRAALASGVDLKRQCSVP